MATPTWRRYPPFASSALIIALVCLVLYTYHYVVDSGRLRMFIDLHTAPSWPPDPAPAGVLLVCAYFPFNASKHGAGEYEAWLEHFLSTMRADVYFFAPPAAAPLIRRLRGALPLTLDTTYADPADIPPLAPMRAQLRAMHAIDPEAGYHNPDLYAVWAAKPFFAATAARAQRVPPRYVFWMDAGTFRRPHVFRAWPDVAAVDAFWAAGARDTGTPADQLVFVPIQVRTAPPPPPRLTGQTAPPPERREWDEVQGPIRMDFAIGSVFGGSPEAMDWWSRTYYTYLAHYTQRGLFAGKDQEVWNAIMILYAERFITVFARDPLLGRLSERIADGPGDCGGWWGYYVHWLATRAERAADARQFFAGRRCAVLPVRGIERVLRATFGRAWRRPRGSVPIPAGAEAGAVERWPPGAT